VISGALADLLAFSLKIHHVALSEPVRRVVVVVFL
jgi:hypothetical protein